MATVEAREPSVQLNGGDAGSQIPVENPATGQIIGHVPDLGAAESKHMVDLARAAQPGWAEMGFEARAKVFYRARKWLVDNRERVARTIVEETGKTQVLHCHDVQFYSAALARLLLNDRMTGDVFSVGMVVTAPTGDPFIRVNGQSIHPTVIQPYLGYIWNSGNFYVHGFESLPVPTSDADVTLLLGPTVLEPPAGARTLRFKTADELLQLATAHAVGADITIATAAVSDWRPAEVAASKVKKTDADLSVRMVRTPDVLAMLGEDRFHPAEVLAERVRRDVPPDTLAGLDDVLGAQRLERAADGHPARGTTETG